MTGTAQLIEGLVEPQSAALMRAYPRNRLGLAVDSTHESDHRTDVKGMHHAGEHICARRDDLPAAIAGLHRRLVVAGVPVGDDACASGTGDDARTRGKSGGRRADHHLTTCWVRPREGTGGVLAAWYPRGEQAVEIGYEAFARRVAGRPRGTQLDGGTYLR